MANTLQIKRKATAGVPSGLAAGELAVNLSDSKLYVGNAAANGVIHLNPSVSASYLPLAGGTLSDDLTIQRSSGNYMQIGHDSDTHYISTVGSNRDLHISASGTVDAADLKISSDGDVTLSGALTISTSTNKILRLNPTISSGGSLTSIAFQRGGTDKWRVFQYEADTKLSFYNDISSLHQLALNSDGSTTFGGDLEVQTASGGELIIDRYGNSGVLLQQKNNGADDSGSLKLQSGTSTIFTAGGTDIFTLASTGYAEFAGSTDVRLTLGSTGTAGSNSAVFIRGNGTTLSFNSPGGNTVWENSGTEKMRLTSTGELQLTTGSSGQTASSGADELVVSGADHTGISILAPAAKRSQLYFNDDAFLRWVTNDGVLSIDTSSSSSKISLAPSGAKVSVNNTTPTSALDVSGAIKSHSTTNKISNGDFSSTSNWTVPTGWSLGSGVASYADTHNAQLHQASVFAASDYGKTFKLTFTIQVGSGGNANIWIGNSSGTNQAYTSNNGYYSYGNGTHTIEIVPTDTSIGFWGNTAGGNFSIDNISCYEQLVKLSDTGTVTVNNNLEVNNTTYIDVPTNTGTASALIWRRLDHTIVGRIVADASNLNTQFWDNNSAVMTIAQDKIGIGTSSPEQTLHVNSAGLNFVAKFESTDDKASILIEDDTTLNYIHSQNGYLSLGGQNSLSASNLNINSTNGSVGVGTTSPSSLLHLYNSATAGNTQLHIHNDKTGDAAVLKLEGKRTGGSDAGQVLFANNSNSIAMIRSHSSADDGDLKFYTSPSGSGSTLTERLSIASTGRATFSGTTGADGVVIAGGESNNFSARLFFDNGVSGESAVIRNENGAMQFLTAGTPGSSSGTKRVIISNAALYPNDNAFSLGLTSKRWNIYGTTGNFNSGVSVTGASTFQGIQVGVDDTGHDVRLYGATSGRYWEWDESMDLVRMRDNVKTVFGNGDDFQIYHDGSHTRINNATGNLNIQANDFHLTDSSNTALSFIVDHDGATGLYFNQSARLTTTSTGATISGDLIVGGAATKLKTYSDSNYSGIYNGSSLGSDEAVYFGNGGTFFICDGYERMRVTGTGRIGINQTSPAATIHAHTTSGHNSAYITTDGNSSSTASLWFAHNYTASADWAGIIWGDDNLLRITNSASGSSNQFVLNETGQLGLNCTPAVRFDVLENDANWAARIKNTHTNGYGLSIDCSANSGTTVFALAAYTGSGTGFFVKNDGTAGLGLTAPSSKLHVNSEISCGADDNNRAMFGYTPSRFYLGTRQSGTNYLNTISVTSGKVGIGTAAPAYTFHCVGTGYFSQSVSLSSGLTAAGAIQANGGFITERPDNSTFITMTQTGNETWTIAGRSGSDPNDYLDIGATGGGKISIHESGALGIKNAAPAKSLHISAGDGDHLMLHYSGSTSNSGGVRQFFQRSTGTEASPTGTSDGDVIGTTSYVAYAPSGSSYRNSAAITVTRHGAANTVSAPAKIAFATPGTADDTLVDRLTILPGGNVFVGDDTDVYANIGRARVGYNGNDSDYASFSHRDKASGSSYALMQSAAGATFLNSASGQSMFFRQNNTNFMVMTSGALYPHTDGAKDLGLNGNRWNNVYSEAGNFSGAVTTGRLSVPNDVNYRAANISEINSSISFRITKTRLDQTKAIAMGCLGSSNSDTGLQCYDTSDNSANTFKIQPFGGSTTFGGPLTVGANDTGHDVRFYGATSGRYWEWDESDDIVRQKDNVKTTFGDGTDLMIWHDGSNSYLQQGSNGGNLNFTNSGGTKFSAIFKHASAVELYNNGVKKFETNTNGVKVTGTLMANILNDAANSANIIYRSGSSTIVGNNANALVVLDNGNTGLGTAAPARKLDVDGRVLADTYGFRSDTTLRWYYFDNYSGSNFMGRGGNAYTALYDTGVLSMSWKEGLVGIGTTAPTSKLHVTGDLGNSAFLAYIYNSGTQSEDNGLNVQIASSGSSAMGLRVNTGGDSNAFIVAGDGDTGLGFTPSNFAQKLNVNGGVYIATILGVGIQPSSIALEVQQTSGTVFKCRGDSGNTRFAVGASGASTLEGNTGSSCLTVTNADSNKNGILLDECKLKVKSWDDGENPFEVVADSGENLFNIRQSGNDCLVRGYKDGSSQKWQIHSDGATYFNGGDFALNSTSPSYLFHCNGDAYVSTKMAIATTPDASYGLKVAGYIASYGHSTWSDQRLKDNTALWDTSEAASLVKDVPVYSYRWNEKCDAKEIQTQDRIGFLANEVEEKINKNDLVITSTDSEKYQSVNQTDMIPILWAALQDALKRIEELENK